MLQSISPFNVVFNATQPVDTADINCVRDNLTDEAVFSVELKTTESGYPQWKSCVVMAGTDYAAWDGSSSQAVDFVLSALNLTKAQTNE